MTNDPSMIEKKITVKGDYELSGTLTLPKSNHKVPLPAVLLIPGSGKVDRDVNIPRLKTNTFKLLADFFNVLGFITLRYDKRGIGQSNGNYLEAGFSDFINDAKCMLKFLKSVPEVDSKQVLVLGHSDGAFIAPTLADNCSGLILLCGAAKSGDELLPEQPRQLVKEIKYGEGAKAYLLKVLQVHRLVNWQFRHVLKKSVNTKKDIIKLFGFLPFNAKWLREFYQYKTAEVLKKIAIPTLVIGGGKDIQVSPAEVNSTCEIINEATGIVLDKMNHLLRNVDSSHSLLNLLKEYHEIIKHPLSPELLSAIKKWCETQDFRFV